MPVIVHEYSVYTRNDQHAYIFWMLHRHVHLAFATLTSHWLFFFLPVSSLYPILIFIVPLSLPLSSLFFLRLLLCILYFNPPIIFLSLHSLRIISIIPLPPLPSLRFNFLVFFPSLSPQPLLLLHRLNERGKKQIKPLSWFRILCRDNEIVLHSLNGCEPC